MKQVRLGRSNLQVSRIAFGTWEGGEWGATDEEAALAAIRHAADRGINFFDTAQGYGFGASERLLARALHGRPRDEVVIATKGGLRPSASGGVERDASPEWIRRGVDESLRALGTDRVDVYQIHWPDPRTPPEETAVALAGLVAAGKIRHVGVSNFDVEQMEAFSATLPVETLQPAYHLFRRDIEAEILPYARAQGIGVLVYGPLAHGLLSGVLTAESSFAADDWRSKRAVFRGEPYRRNLRIVSALVRFAELELGTSVSRLAVAWALANPAVHVAIVGTRNPKHIDDLVRDEVPVGGPSPETV